MRIGFAFTRPGQDWYVPVVDADRLPDVGERIEFCLTYPRAPPPGTYVVRSYRTRIGVEEDPNARQGSPLTSIVTVLVLEMDEWRSTLHPIRPRK